MTMHWALAVSVVLVSIGCHPAQAPVTSPTTAQVVPQSDKPSSAAAASQGKANRRPSQTMTGRWTAPPSPLTVGYADWGALVATTLFQRLIPSAAAALESYQSKEAAECLKEWAAAAREVVGSANDRDFVVVVTYDESRLKAPIARCIQAFSASSRIDLPHAEQAYETDGTVVALSSGTAVIGRKSLVEASLLGGNVQPLPADLALEVDQQLTFAARAEERQLGIRGYLSVTDEQFLIHVDVTYPSLERAKAAAETLSQSRIREQLLDQSPAMHAVVDSMVEHWHVRQQRNQVTFELKIAGNLSQIAERLGTLTAIAVYGVRRSLHNTRIVEARKTLGAIAEQLTLTNAKKLTALPAVPQSLDAVRGKTYRSTVEDWRSWKPIDFSLTKSQYYQYRVEVSKDKKSGRIIAEGDLDGNGKNSRFWVNVHVDPKTRMLDYDPVVEEQDPFE